MGWLDEGFNQLFGMSNKKKHKHCSNGHHSRPHHNRKRGSGFDWNSYKARSDRDRANSFAVYDAARQHFNERVKRGY